MSNDNSIYDNVEFVAHDLETMRKQYERLRYDHVVTLQKLEALRNEVQAWREADEREDMLFNTLGEEDRNRILQAITNTDTINALEDER